MNNYDLFELAFGGSFKQKEGLSLLTKVDDLDKEYKVYIEVPGLTQDKIDVDFKDSTLSVKLNYDEKDLLRTAAYGTKWKFKGVDSNSIDAKLDLGILTITLQKKPEELSKKIEIK